MSLQDDIARLKAAGVEVPEILADHVLNEEDGQWTYDSAYVEELAHVLVDALVVAQLIK